MTIVQGRYWCFQVGGGGGVGEGDLKCRLKPIVFKFGTHTLTIKLNSLVQFSMTLIFSQPCLQVCASVCVIQLVCLCVCVCMRLCVRARTRVCVCVCVYDYETCKIWIW